MRDYEVYKDVMEVAVARMQGEMADRLMLGMLRKRVFLAWATLVLIFWAEAVAAIYVSPYRLCELST